MAPRLAPARYSSGVVVIGIDDIFGLQAETLEIGVKQRRVDA